MNTIECNVTVGPNGRITLPTEIAHQLPIGEKLRVTLCWDSREDADESPDDELDDELIDEPLTR
jgi:hypothetical protein